MVRVPDVPGFSGERGMKIRTSHDYPPIPIRNFDWSACVDGTEETGPYGHGRTEAEAIADLEEKLEDGE